MDGNRGGRNKRRGRGYGAGGSPARGRGGSGNGREPTNSPSKNDLEQAATPASPVPAPAPVPVPVPARVPMPEPVVESPVVVATTPTVTSTQPDTAAGPTLTVQETVTVAVPSPDEATLTPVQVESIPETKAMSASTSETEPSSDKKKRSSVSSSSSSPVVAGVESTTERSPPPEPAHSPDPEFVTPINSPEKSEKIVEKPEVTGVNKSGDGNKTPPGGTTPVKEEPQVRPKSEEFHVAVEQFSSPIKEREELEKGKSPPSPVPVPVPVAAETTEIPVSEDKPKTKVTGKVPSRKNSPVSTPQQQAAVAAAAVAEAEMASLAIQPPQQQQLLQQNQDQDQNQNDNEHKSNGTKIGVAPGAVPDETLLPIPVPPLALKKNLDSHGHGHEHGPGPTVVQGKPGYLGGVPSSRSCSVADSNEFVLSTKSDRDIGSGSGPSGASSEGFSCMGFNKRQLLTLLVFSLADFFSAIIISLQAPFYPAEAELKGATATEYGLVFGIFELVVFIMSPIYGKYLHKVGPKLVFNAGILTTGVTTVLFGFLDRFSDHTSFIALSFVVRTIEAMGSAAFVTASFAIIAQEFPNSVATTFASLETFFGLGLIVGPTLGGALYQSGGFTLPFGVMGGLLFAVALVTYFVMPESKEPIDDDSGKESPAGVLSILKIPAVSLAAFSIVTGAITIGFLNSTLEPHIRQFALTPVLTGLVFIINGGLYAVTAPAWGWICDKTKNPRIISLIGAITIFIGFIFIGPAPFLPLDTVLWLTCVGLVVHGIGLGATLVSAFIMALQESIDHGFADNIQTYGLTSALWTSSFALGSFIGPSIGGVLLDEFGFRWASLFVLGSQVLVTILILGFLTKTRRAGYYTKNSLSPESAPLLGSNEPCSSKTALALEKERNNSYGAVRN